MNLWTTSGIYQIHCTQNKKRYVGSAKSIGDRWNKHVRFLSKGQHVNPHLQNAWNKYKADAFDFEVLEEVIDPTQLIVREQYWIDQLGASNPKTGFNIKPTAGSSLGYKHTKATKTKMRKAWINREVTVEAKRSRIASLRKSHPERVVLNEKLVEVLKGRIAAGANLTQLALEYGVSLASLVHMKLGHSWAYVGPDVSSTQSLFGHQHKTNSKLSPEQVVQIKKHIVAGERLVDIAKKYKVYPQVLSDIKQGHLWKNIPPDISSLRLKCGTRMGNTKLTEKQVAQIKYKLAQGTYSIQHIANEFKVSTTTIRCIHRGRTWGHTGVGQGDK